MFQIVPKTILFTLDSMFYNPVEPEENKCCYSKKELILKYKKTSLKFTNVKSNKYIN